MIKTFKVKHCLNLDSILFERAQEVARFALDHIKEPGYKSSKDVKHIGLNSAISCQILRKYGRLKKIKKLRLAGVKLTVPGQVIKPDTVSKTISVTCLSVTKRSGTQSFRYWFDEKFEKINQIEFDETYAYVSVTIKEKPLQEYKNYFGIDLNSTSHSVVVADPKSGRVKKLGKQIPFLKKKYRAIRKNLQSQKKFRELKKINNREHLKTRHLVHEITRKIVNLAAREQLGIKIEDLKGIRKRCNKQYHREANHTLNSWPFFMIRSFLIYKAKELGVELVVVDPKFTSQRCSRCQHVDKESRCGKRFVCTKCTHADHADANAAFNIALQPVIGRTSEGKVASPKGPILSQVSNVSGCETTQESSS